MFKAFASRKDIEVLTSMLDEYHMLASSILAALAKRARYSNIICSIDDDIYDNVSFCYIYPQCCCKSQHFSENYIWTSKDGINELFHIRLNMNVQKDMYKDIKASKSFIDVFLLATMFLHQKNGYSFMTNCNGVNYYDNHNIVLLGINDTLENIIIENDLDSVLN